MRSRSLCAAIVCSVGFFGACHKSQDEGSPDSLEASTPVTGAGPSGMASAGHAVVLPPRCHATDRKWAIDNGRAAADVDLGDGLALGGDDYAVGLVRDGSSGRVPSVARLRADTGDMHIVDLAPTFEDAPPPELALCRGTLLAAAFRLPDKDGGLEAPRGPSQRDPSNRALALYAVDSPEPRKAMLSIPQRRDDSLAFDLACAPTSGIVVWDETVPSLWPAARRGVIRAASFEMSERLVSRGPPVDVSPPDSDAEMARVVSAGQGFDVFWVARSAESKGAPEVASGTTGGPGAVEVIGEKRARGWVEMIAVDASGKPAGEVRRLTPPSGHVSAYDVRVQTIDGQPIVIVIVRDDQESSDGAGGTLLRVRFRNDAIDGPTELTADGLGRGAPTFVDGPATWLAWVSPHEQLRLLPLGRTGDALGPASAEEGFDDGRPLLSLGAVRRGSGSDAEGAVSESRLLVASQRASGAELLVFGCRQ